MDEELNELTSEFEKFIKEEKQIVLAEGCKVDSPVVARWKKIVEIKGTPRGIGVPFWVMAIFGFVSIRKSKLKALLNRDNSDKLLPERVKKLETLVQKLSNKEVEEKKEP